MNKLFIVTVLISVAFSTMVSANQLQPSRQKHQGLQDRTAPNLFNIRSYGNFKKMVHMNKIAGVVDLQQALAPEHIYAVGALGQGLGEITVINNRVWLDYGEDGLGNSSREIPANEKAVLLVTTQVSQWHSILIEENLLNKPLNDFILEQAKNIGLDISEPFPFLLEGMFGNLNLHVISGPNSKFGGHGSNEPFYKQTRASKQEQEASVFGFYSAGNSGVYTHPGESWHLHAIIESKKIGAHVDGIEVKKNTILKLPIGILVD